MKKLILYSIGIFASLGLVSAAEAATVVSSLNVSATGLAACSVSTTPMNFGTVTGQDAANASGQVAVNCSSGIPYTVKMSAGQHYDGRLRNISDGANYRSYMLFVPTGTDEWGDGGMGETYPWGTVEYGIGNGMTQPYTVLGTLDGGAALAPGIYSDTVIAIVEY